MPLTPLEETVQQSLTGEQVMGIDRIDSLDHMIKESSNYVICVNKNIKICINNAFRIPI